MVGRPRQEPPPEELERDPNAKVEWEKQERRARRQESHFNAILQEDYIFRQAVARAVGQPNSEAVELASLAVEMWRSIPPSSLICRDRGAILKDEVLKGKIPKELVENEDNPSDESLWVNVRDRLAVNFARNPQKAMELWDAIGWPYPFALVLREELKQIEARRDFFSSRPVSRPVSEFGAHSGTSADSPEPSDIPEPDSIPVEGPDIDDDVEARDASDLAVQLKLFGVAFSGGGIRSATFNLGVLQQLAHFGLLGEVDYLSTVSGGGYIGSWLTGWMQKRKTNDPAEFRHDTLSLLSPKIPDPRADPQRPLRFLREFSNYLTPRLGSFSFDTWTMAAVYSRNLFLNQATLICFLGVLLLIPRFLVYPLCSNLDNCLRWILAPLSVSVRGVRLGGNLIWIAAVLLVSAGVYFMSVNVRYAVGPDEKSPNKIIIWFSSLKFIVWLNQFSRAHVQFTVIWAFLAGLYFGSVWIWRHIDTLGLAQNWVVLGVAAVIAMFLSLLLSLNGGFVDEFSKRQVGKGGWWIVLGMITILSAGAMTGLLYVYLCMVHQLRSMGDQGAWHAVIWSPVMLLAVMVIPGTLQVGLMGVDFPDAGREWLSRFRAICTVYSVWWIALMGASIYGPQMIMAISTSTVLGIRAWMPTLTAGWVVTTIGGILAGKSSKTGTDKGETPKFSWLQLLARTGPPVFAIGLMLLIATGEKMLLTYGRETARGYWDVPDLPCPWNSAAWHVGQLEGLFMLLLAAGIILAWRVDINEFSMHHFYKNRLVRCYLGASNENRQPNDFTGFDAQDDLRLARLKAIPDKDPDTPYLGPYPILNTTLNLSAGEQLAWQERKGTSFILSPCFCGFDTEGWASSRAKKKRPSGEPHRSEKLLPAGYRKTSGYTHKDGPFLGTSVSISGAAANPNQGYNTSPMVAFLMTMFDVRLGWWLGNPRRDVAWRLSSPTFGLAALLSELVGMTNDTAPFVNLSDGGHFDNMGLYELVRRRCSFILLCDAEQDPEFKFEGLGSAIRKCRIDFGACVEIDTSLIRPGKGGKPSGNHCAVGSIVYLDGSEGTLVYVKPSLTSDEPEDVTQYHQAHADFPHETTADQWFTESQFESYRALGFHAMEQTLKPAGAWIEWKPEQPDVSGLIDALKKYWYPENPNLKDNASRNTATLIKMLDTIRETVELRTLGSKLFPESLSHPQEMLWQLRSSTLASQSCNSSKIFILTSNSTGQSGRKIHESAGGIICSEHGKGCQKWPRRGLPHKGHSERISRSSGRGSSGVSRLG